MDGKQLKNSILQWAIQGKLVPQNPKDEPAQKLLERIAASRNGGVSPWSEAIGSSKNSKKSLSTSLRGAKATKQSKNPPSRIYRENGVWYEQVGTATPKDISDEIPFEIPENWVWARWGELSDSIQYGYNAPALQSGRIKMVRISDIHDNKIEWDKVPYCQIKESEISTYLLQKNDILFARTGGTVGKSYLVSDVTTEAVYAGYLIRTRYNFDLLSPQYLKFFMESSLYWEQLREGTIATAQPNCNGKTLGKMLLPLPPLAEQKRIVAKLEQVLPLAEEYRAAQEQLDKLNKELPEALKKSILQEAIQGKLVPQNPKDDPASVLLEKIRKEKQELVEQGKLKKKDLVIDPVTKEELSFALPEKWEICRLGDLCYLVDGEKTSLTEILLDAKYLRGKSSAEKIQGGRFVKKGDNIILVDGENSGEVFEVPIDGIMGSTFKQIIVNKTMYKPYVMIQILAYKDLLRNSKKGAAIPHLNKDIFRNLPIGIPPISEQKRIVAKLEQLFKVL